MSTDERYLAGRGVRLGAQIIDAIIACLIYGVTLMLVPGWIDDGLAIIGFLAYYLLADGLSNGQSLGKRLLDISVIDDDTGRPCDYAKSFLRNATQVVGIFDWLWIFGAKRKRLGDMLARTSVVTGMARR